MAHREDQDLEFLHSLKSEDLNDLVQTLLFDKGSPRFTESLSTTDKYKKYSPNHSKYINEIIEEIQLFGGNTLANIGRGRKGVQYKEILIDVSKKLKVNFNKDSKAEIIENNLLLKILEDALEKMSQEEIKELGDSIGLENTSKLTAQAMISIFIKVFKSGGFKSYQLTVIIANAILKAILGRGLTIAGNAALTRTMAVLTGPIGWVITGLWTAIDIAGPAYRVTIPTVIQIAVLRQQYLYKDVTEDIKFS